MSDTAARSEALDFRTLLLVEDNPGDARLLKEAFSPVLADRLRVVSTGQEALDLVNQHGEYVDAQRPAIILLDWHLVDMNGEEVLAELKSDSDHDHIPIIVLTGSQSEQELRNAYAKGANACINKTAELDKLKTKFVHSRTSGCLPHDSPALSTTSAPLSLTDIGLFVRTPTERGIHPRRGERPITGTIDRAFHVGPLLTSGTERTQILT